MTGEVLLPVVFALLVRPGTVVDDGCKTVASHPHAYPQCRRWLAANLPDAEWLRRRPPTRMRPGWCQEGQYNAALAGVFAGEQTATTWSRWPPTSTTSRGR